MGLATFKGGVHPFEGKELSKDKPVTTLLPKGDLVFPMSQHIGAPANPVVAKGDRVLVGQLLGETGGFVSANVISSVSGTVKAVEPRLTVSGNMVNSVVVENDNLYESVEGMGQERDYEKLFQAGNPQSDQECRDCGNGRCRIPNTCKIDTKR